MTPYFADDRVTLYCGDAREIIPQLGPVDACVTDPPYGETTCAWDSWPSGWPGLVAGLTSSLWCFASLRLLLDRAPDFAGWKLSHEIVWQKHNGSSLHADRFRKIHELAAHFYRGKWSAIHKEPQFTMDATARTVRRKRKPTHWSPIKGASYESTDGGPKLMRSIIAVRSCHGHAVHPTQKPEAIVLPLVQYAVPPGGVVLDPFAGSGTTLVVAAKTGRRAIGIEGSEEYCALAVDRLRQLRLAA